MGDAAEKFLNCNPVMTTYSPGMKLEVTSKRTVRDEG